VWTQQNSKLNRCLKKKKTPGGAEESPLERMKSHETTHDKNQTVRPHTSKAMCEPGNPHGSTGENWRLGK